MKSTWIWLVPMLALFVSGAVSGCGGDADGGDTSAGKGGGGASGDSGTSPGGAANQGGTGGKGGVGPMSGGMNSAGESSLEDCNPAECGPQLGLPNWKCADGSVGGPTGRCIRRSSASCGWEINNCPPAGEGGAPSQGGQGNAAGAAGATADACGGCDPSAQEICVFQVGGPGPSHFVCAMQNPCGAAGACACIVGQGTCQQQLMGDPPGYCVCENGLK